MRTRVFKTIALILCCVVTLNCFSCARKINAAAVTVTGVSAAAIAIIAFIGTAVSSAITDYEHQQQLNDYIKTKEFSESFTTDSAGNILYIGTQGSDIDTVLNAAVNQYNLINSNGDIKTFGGSSLTLGYQIYNNAVNQAAEDITGNPFNLVYGDSGWLSRTSSFISQKESVPVFDYLNLNYKLFTNIDDISIEFYFTDWDSRTYFYFCPFIITNDNKLYLFKAELLFDNKASMSSQSLKYRPENRSHFYEVTSNLSYGYSSYLSFRFYVNNGKLYPSFFRSEYDGNYRYLRNQWIYGNPSLDIYPVLFDDKRNILNVSSSVQAKNDFQNILLDKVPEFVNATDHNDVISGDKALSLGIITCGYFKGDKDVAYFDSVTLSSAGNMLEDQESIYQPPITSNVITTPSDIDKAVISQGISSGIVNDNESMSTYNPSLKFDGLQNSSGALDVGVSVGNPSSTDKDKEYVPVGDLWQHGNSLDKDDLGSYVGNNQAIKDSIKDGTYVGNIDITDTINKFETPSSITTKFPFSLPFDIYNIFNLLSAPPQTPKFNIPLDFTSFGGDVYDIEIDLSDFDEIANVVRWLLYGVF